MIELTNYSSGEIEIADGNGHRLRLAHPQANRLVLAARMHTVAEFLEKTGALIPQAELAAAVRARFAAAGDASARWNLKETFARLRTVAPEAVPAAPVTVVERATLA